ncbi:MAG: hypothetical protein V1889_03250 [archaeon]
MKWGRLVLIFQAIVTFILGAVFLSQVIVIDTHKIIQGENATNVSQNPLISINLSEIKTRYSAASYILLFVSLIELLIITRLLT